MHFNIKNKIQLYFYRFDYPGTVDRNTGETKNWQPAMTPFCTSMEEAKILIKNLDKDVRNPKAYSIEVSVEDAKEVS